MDYNTRLTLIARLKDDDSAAWDEFVRAYSKYIYVIIRNMNIRHHDAEDLQSQVIQKAMKGLPNFEYDPEKSRFRSWIVVITKNSVRNFKALKSSQLLSLQGSESDNLQDYLNKIEDSEIEIKAEKEWQNYLVNMAIDNIKDNFQDHVFNSFQLQLNEKLSVHEIAAKLDSKYDTVQKHINRVQKALYREIKRLNYELS